MIGGRERDILEGCKTQAGSLVLERKEKAKCLSIEEYLHMPHRIILWNTIQPFK